MRKGLRRAATLTVLTVAAICAIETAAIPAPSPGAKPCSDAVKRVSSSSEGFNVRYRVRCGFILQRIDLRFSRDVLRVERSPAVQPAAPAALTCERRSPRRAVCSGAGGTSDATIVVGLRFRKKAVCRKPRLTVNAALRGERYCPPGTPCTAEILGATTTRRVSGC
jgi:hypothetical protein